MRHKLLLPLSLLLLVAACSTYRPELTPEGPHWVEDDRKNIDDPGKTDPILLWQSLERTSFEQIEQTLDLNRSFHDLTGNGEAAWNINTYDEVPNSTWYTNRHHLKPMTRDELIRGAIVGADLPDTSGKWIVSRPKVGGVTPGFWITDPKGDTYILKFDPPGHPDMATSSAVIASRFFHAAGYNVPQESIVYWRPEQLQIKDNLIFKDIYGIRREFTQEDLDAILADVNRLDDGRIRSLASRLLPGVRGPFSFDDTRENDPNDWCPHEHRRELRALSVMASLVNHWDIKDQNTMDILVKEDDRQYLKHYLLDFGSCLGSAGNRPQEPIHGYANKFDPRDAFFSFITLGLKKWQWEDAPPPQHPSVGYFESKIFHPAKWDPIYPIPAFENMTHADAYWGAKVVMSFRDDDLRALIAAGEIGSTEANEYLFVTLRERRDKIGRHWFSKVNPVDYFAVLNHDDTLTIAFEDLALNYGLNHTSEHRYTIRYQDRTLIPETPFEGTKIQLAADTRQSLISEYAGDGNESDRNARVYEIRIESRRDGGRWSPPTSVWLWYHPNDASFQLVGVEHHD